MGSWMKFNVSQKIELPPMLRNVYVLLTCSFTVKCVKIEIGKQNKMQWRKPDWNSVKCNVVWQ